jgi:hypothetical protein
MKTKAVFAALALGALFCAGCASDGYSHREPAYLVNVSKGSVLPTIRIDAATQDRVLALDPDHVTSADVAAVLSKCPAPRIINIHGGVWPVYRAMESFSKFLIGMGYPEARIRNPRTGAYSYSCYQRSSDIAGAVAWHYEREAMRPMIIGHSQGGMQAVKVLHELAGAFRNHQSVWNPVLGRAENRDWIVDPYTRRRRPVVGVQASYASAVGAGGLTRFLPNQWALAGRLRSVPDTVEEFTGFYKHGDLLGGDALGFGSGNEYRPNGMARVRTVLLPFSHDHYFVPFTQHLAGYRQTRDWINSYVQTDEPNVDVDFDAPAVNIVWAADVWTSVKRHWVLELQHLIREKRKSADAH